MTLRENVFNAPPSFVTAIKSVTRNIKSLGPLSYVHLLAVQFKKNAIAPVVVLFFVCCPSTIFGTIIPVGVNSVNGKNLARTRSHIVFEVNERFAPSIANRNSTTPIQFIGVGGWVFAPLNNSSPNTINARFFGLTMYGCKRFVSFNEHFGFNAPATICESLSEASRKSGLFFSAITHTPIVCPFFFCVSNTFNNKQPTEATPDKIFDVHICPPNNNICFSATKSNIKGGNY